MTSREIAADRRAEMELPENPTAYLCFLQISHTNLPDPIRVVCDPLDYVWRGETWVGIVFEFKILSDDDSPPFTEIEVPNLDRRIGNAVRQSRERAKVALYLLGSDEFDLTQNPRQPIGVPQPIYFFEEFELSQVSANVTTIRGRITLRDYATEPWPGISATQSRFPGLFL